MITICTLSLHAAVLRNKSCDHGINRFSFFKKTCKTQGTGFFKKNILGKQEVEKRNLAAFSTVLAGLVFLFQVWWKIK